MDLTEEDYTQLKGPLDFRLTNDFFFKTFLQRNEDALRGLLCALLDIALEDINSIEILNPIEEGTWVDDKTCILDVKIMLNNNQIINIEMQVLDLKDWEERSLTYLCRTFDQLKAGEDYTLAKKTLHIGILDYTPQGFPAQLFSKYYICEEKTGHKYSDKLGIYMLQLNQLGNREDEEKMPDLYYWAKLFHATTWEEILMLAEKNQGIKKSIVTLHKMTEDEKIREQCEGRERYQKDMLAATKIGLEEGLEQGIEQGMICTLQDLGYTYEETYTKFKVKFERTDDECKQKMDLYWKK